MQATEPFILKVHRAPKMQEEMLLKMLSLEPGSPEAMELHIEYKALFGPDTFSGSWYPTEELPDPDDVLLFDGSPCSSPFDLKGSLRAYLYWSIMDNLKCFVVDKKANLVSCLYNPSQYVKGMDKAAFFRQHFIWPHFRSVKNFFHFMMKFRGDIVGVRLPELPDLSMTMGEVMDYFQRKGDSDGLQLAQIFSILVPHGGDDLLGLLNRRSSVTLAIRNGWA